MTDTDLPGGTFRVADLTFTRMGYGAMQLPGPGVFGPPRDREQALAVLRTAIELGIRHIDTADFYGPHVSNELIREALHPYPDDLVIVTKVGAVRDEQGGWNLHREPDQLRSQVDDNLRRLGVDALDVVNLRLGDRSGVVPGSIAETFGVLADLQRQGKIRHLGLSVVDPDQVGQARAIAPVVTVQNLYNVAHRDDDPLVDALAADGIAYVPFFPLGGFDPLQAAQLDSVAKRLDVTPMAVALAWLLHRSPNVLLIPGTSSVAHLRENVAAAALDLPSDALAELDTIGR